MTQPTDDLPDDAEHNLPTPPTAHAIWSDLGFGPGLGALILSVLAVQPTVSSALGGIVGEDSAYPFLANLLPVAAGLAAIGLGLWTLRTSSDKLGRAFAVAAMVVGLFAVVSGSLGWYGTELVRDQSSSYSSSCTPTTIDPGTGDPAFESSLTITPDLC